MKQGPSTSRRQAQRSACAAAAWLVFSSTSLAQSPDEPLVQREEPGVIITELFVPASEQEVLALLNDPEAFSRFTPDVQGIRVQPRGRCKLLDFDSRGLFEPLQYSTLRCPSSKGWRETLLSSESFTRYDADLQLRPVTGGTNITYKLSVGIDLPVPDLVISKNVKRSARLTMQAVFDLFTRPSEPAPVPALEPSDAP